MSNFKKLPIKLKDHSLGAWFISIEIKIFTASQKVSSRFLSSRIDYHGI